MLDWDHGNGSTIHIQFPLRVTSSIAVSLHQSVDGRLKVMSLLNRMRGLFEILIQEPMFGAMMTRNLVILSTPDTDVVMAINGAEDWESCPRCVVLLLTFDDAGLNPKLSLNIQHNFKEKVIRFPTRKS